MFDQTTTSSINNQETSLMIKESKKINFIDELFQLQSFYNSNQVQSQGELSQNKKEKKSFYLSLMKLKNKKKSDSEPIFEQKQLMDNFDNFLITDYFKAQKKKDQNEFDESIFNSDNTKFDSTQLSVDINESTFDGYNACSRYNDQLSFQHKRDMKRYKKKEQKMSKIDMSQRNLFDFTDQSSLGSQQLNSQLTDERQNSCLLSENYYYKR